MPTLYAVMSERERDGVPWKSVPAAQYPPFDASRSSFDAKPWPPQSAGALRLPSIHDMIRECESQDGHVLGRSPTGAALAPNMALIEIGSAPEMAPPHIVEPSVSELPDPVRDVFFNQRNLQGSVNTNNAVSVALTNSGNFNVGTVHPSPFSTLDTSSAPGSLRRPPSGFFHGMLNSSGAHLEESAQSGALGQYRRQSSVTPRGEVADFLADGREKTRNTGLSQPLGPAAHETPQQYFQELGKPGDAGFLVPDYRHAHSTHMSSCSRAQPLGGASSSGGLTAANSRAILRDIEPDRMYWTPEEDAQLELLVCKYGAGNWRMLAQNHMPDRSGKQMRSRWLYTLQRRSEQPRMFTPDEDARILELYEQYGRKWATIARHMPDRTDQDVKHRFSKLAKKLERRGQGMGSPEVTGELQVYYRSRLKYIRCTVRLNYNSLVNRKGEDAQVQWSVWARSDLWARLTVVDSSFLKFHKLRGVSSCKYSNFTVYLLPLRRSIRRAKLFIRIDSCASLILLSCGTKSVASTRFRIPYLVQNWRSCDLDLTLRRKCRPSHSKRCCTPRSPVSDCGVPVSSGHHFVLK
ncbi:Transcription factor MYB44 [Porphyridium purpureum]|uniref:Transcription factor MYB44 n=1 Tax=Porphyridium purpureum TaxID=35688 RepID=A0A5J4YX17_PORPP|nr:Transcription factor MYB44 [Porphyridium purpureum]|eukprot:POR9518..scf209_3